MKQITEKQQIKINATKNQFYEKINKIHKALVSLIKKENFTDYQYQKQKGEYHQ